MYRTGGGDAAGVDAARIADIPQRRLPGALGRDDRVVVAVLLSRLAARPGVRGGSTR